MPEETVEEKKPSELVDINDLSLDSSEVEINPEADAFAFPPPPPESGNPYRVKLTGESKKWKHDVDKNKHEYFLAPLEAKIVQPDGPHDGKILFDGGFLSTSPGPNGTSRIAGVLQLIYEQRGQGETVPVKAKQQEFARLLQAEFDRETEIGAIIRWEAFCKNENNGKGLKISGESKFKQREDKSHEGTITCPRCKTELQAQAKIQRYVKLS